MGFGSRFGGVDFGKDFTCLHDFRVLEKQVCLMRSIACDDRKSFGRPTGATSPRVQNGYRYASQAPRLSSRAQRSATPAERSESREKWCAADPGPKYPGIRKKALQGYLGPGSRASRSAGTTTEATVRHR